MDSVLAVGPTVRIVLAVDGLERLVEAGGDLLKEVAGVALENRHRGKRGVEGGHGVGGAERRVDACLRQRAFGIESRTDGEGTLEKLELRLQLGDRLRACPMLFELVLPEDGIAALVTGPELVHLRDDGLHLTEVERLRRALARVVVHVRTGAAGPEPVHREPGGVELQSSGPLLHKQKVVKAIVPRCAASGAIHTSRGKRATQGLGDCTLSRKRGSGGNDHSGSSTKRHYYYFFVLEEKKRNKRNKNS